MYRLYLPSLLLEMMTEHLWMPSLFGRSKDEIAGEDRIASILKASAHNLINGRDLLPIDAQLQAVIKIHWEGMVSSLWIVYDTKQCAACCLEKLLHFKNPPLIPRVNTCSTSGRTWSRDALLSVMSDQRSLGLAPQPMFALHVQVTFESGTCFYRLNRCLTISSYMLPTD
jgi:hypothetical protein